MSTFDVDPPPDGRAMEAVLRDRRFGPPPPDDATPWAFVLRWRDDVIRTRAWPVISRMLVDDDALIRVRALEFVRDWSDGAALTTPRLLDIAENNAHRIEEKVEGVPVCHTLAHALSNRADVQFGPRIARLLRTLCGGKSLPGGGAASVLGRYEPQFVISEAQRRGDSELDWIDEAARSLALFRRDEVVPLLTALRSLAPMSRERVLGSVVGYMKRDDAVAAALATSMKLPVPVRPAPSENECRRAIGLS